MTTSFTALTTTKLIEIKKSAFKPQFKDLVGLKKAPNHGDFLGDFGVLMHPGAAKVHQAEKLEVFGNKHYIYTLYEKLILRTTVDSGERIAYKY